MATFRDRDAKYRLALLAARTELDSSLDRWINRALNILAADYDFFHAEVEALFTVKDWISLSAVNANASGKQSRAGALLNLLVWRGFSFSGFSSVVRDRPYKFIELLDLHYWRRIEEDGGLLKAKLNTGYWKRAYFWANMYVHTHVRAIIEILYKDLDMVMLTNDDDDDDKVEMSPKTREQEREFAPLALPTTISGSIPLLEQYLVPFATTGLKINNFPVGAALDQTFPNWVADEKDLGRIGFDPLVTNNDTESWTLEFARVGADTDASVFELEGGGPLRLREWIWTGMPNRENSSRLLVGLGGIQARQPDGEFTEPLKVYPMLHAIDVETMLIAIGGLMRGADDRITFEEPELSRYNKPEFDNHFRGVALVANGNEYADLDLEEFVRFECFAMAPDYEFLLALPDSGWLVAFDDIMREPTSDAARMRDALRRDGKLVFWKCNVCTSTEVKYTNVESMQMYCDKCKPR
jgi:hypothetical protein